MKNYCILKTPATEESKPSLTIMVNQKKQAVIWCDGIISFTPEIDYEIEEVSYFIQISKMFYSFYNNLKN